MRLETKTHDLVHETGDPVEVECNYLKGCLTTVRVLVDTKRLMVQQGKRT